MTKKEVESVDSNQDGNMGLAEVLENLNQMQLQNQDAMRSLQAEQDRMALLLDRMMKRLMDTPAPSETALRGALDDSNLGAETRDDADGSRTTQAEDAGPDPLKSAITNGSAAVQNQGRIPRPAMGGASVNETAACTGRPWPSDPARLSSRSQPKLPICSADPWNASESGSVVMWLNMALAAVRRLRDVDRIEIELWLRTRIGTRRWQNWLHRPSACCPGHRTPTYSSTSGTA